jgi:hypothetical protein
MAALLKLTELGSLLKMWAFLILFNKEVSEAIDKWRERGGSGSAETFFKF